LPVKAEPHLMVVYLIRHGHHDLLGKVLCGRGHDVRLSPQGRDEMRAAAAQLRTTSISLVQSSPQKRTQDSAAIVADSCNVPVETIAAFDEHDAGLWSGRPFNQLQNVPHWHRWNSERATVTPPNGESMANLQARVIAHLDALKHIQQEIAIVSHAEPIRAALMHYLDVPLDRYWTVDVAPASIHAIDLVTRIVTPMIPQGAAA
jgi:probable phosphoglycerate mutase